MLLQKPTRPNWKKVLLAAAAAAVLILILDIGCIFRRITGIPCPGCGMTRAHLAVLSLDFKQAFYFHPLWFLVGPLFLVQLFFPEGLFQNQKINDLLVFILIALILGVYAVRMILFFPDTPPMEYQSHSLFGWIWSLIRRTS